MSDETPPPSLRLKPRQRTEGEAPPAAQTPPPAPAAPAEPEGGKLRLKPKLNVEPPAAAAPEEPAVAPAAPPEKIRLKPKLNAEPAAAEEAAPAEEASPAPAAPAAPPEAPPAPPAPEEGGGKIKLKIKVPGAAIEAAAADEAAKSPPPFPVAPPLPNAPGAPGAPKPGPGLKTPGMMRPGPPPGRRLPPAVLAASNRKKKIMRLVLVGLGSIALAAGIMGLAIVKFINPPPAPPPRLPPRPVVVTPPPKAEPAPETVKPTEPEETEKAEAKPTLHARPKSGATSNSVTTDLAAGITVTTQAVQAEVEASQEFRTYVADAKISGVFQGSPARAFINGRLIRAGETVDSALGITFDSVDATTKTIVFKDASGAKVSRRY